MARPSAKQRARESTGTRNPRKRLDHTSHMAVVEKRYRSGRPSMLTIERSQRIIGAVEDGNHLNNACALGGVSVKTLYNWLRRADEMEALLAENPERDDLDDDDWRYLRFRDDLMRARAEAEDRAVSTVKRVMMGGSLISRRPALNSDGLPIYDQNGDLTYEETWTQPDGRLAMLFLSVSWPDRWGKSATQRFEIVGVGAEPGERENPEAAAIDEGITRAIALRLAEAKRLREEEDQRAIGAGAGIEDADVVDGEGEL
jgi:hypothetical protein